MNAAQLQPVTHEGLAYYGDGLVGGIGLALEAGGGWPRHARAYTDGA